ncbi:MAG: hypothetical protein CMJ18_22990 [Phycisphaeraceae bacterium]|nr:hypothetical protein [Phycisphaeraceae bacterium]
MTRLLVIKPSSLGDIIHAAGPVAWIARSAPDLHVSWIVNDAYASFVRLFPGVREIIAFPRERFRRARFPRWLGEAAGWVRHLRDFDVALDLQGLQRSALMARLSGAAERYGPSDARELGWMHYNCRVEVPPGVTHAIDRLWVLARELVSTSRRLDAHPPDEPPSAFRLPVPDAEHARSLEVVGASRPIIALCPGSRWQSKHWPVARWADLIRALHDRHADHHTVFLGAPNERPMVEEILAQDGVAGPHVVNLAGSTDLWGTAAILARARCAVTLDSAPLHLAAAVGTPVVALFGPTDPKRVGPRADQGVVIARRDLDCLECYERKCPLAERVCLPGIEAAEVMEAIERRVRNS